MKRTLVVVAAILAVVVLVLLTVRVQPAGSARVVRKGESLRVVSGRVGFVPPGGQACIGTFADGLARFDRAFDAEDAGGETIPVAVRFDYTVPDRVPASWPEGDWCASLASRVEQIAKSWIAKADVDTLRRDPRAAGESSAASVEKTLADLRPRSLTVRPTIPKSALATLPIAEIASRATKAPPVIFIGLDGADWQLLEPWMRDGSMPNLQSLVREGTAGDLLTEHPPLSPLLWSTMMTGASPLEHEILDFTRFHPATGRKEPITSDERKVPAVWNMATQAGKSSAVFGLWATYPAEPVRGLVVSDRFFTFLFSESAPPKGTVYPPAREPWARKVLADVETEIDYARVAKYLPWLSREEFDQRRTVSDPYSHPVSALRRILVETTVYDRLAKQYLGERLPDVTILYIQGTDSVGHVFAPYTAPQQPHISEDDFARYSQVPAQYFREIDRLLGDYKALAQKHGARLMIASDHGFHWFDDRPTELSSFAASTAAKWHRKAGVYLLWGNGIAARGRTGPEQHIAQVASTLLALSGTPNGDRVASPPIVVPAMSASVDYRKHFIPIEPPAAESTSQAAADEELAKLKSLGYIAAGESTVAPSNVAGKSTHTAGWYNNRGLILKDRKQMDDAMVAFEKSIELDPNLASALWNFSDLLLQLNRDLDRADALLVRAFAAGLPEGRKYLIGRAIGYQRTGSASRSLTLLEQAVSAKPDDVELRLFRGRYRIEAEDCAGALEDFRAAINLAPENAVPYASAGIAEMCLGRTEDARRNFARSLQIDPNQPRLQAFLRD
ncbi:MAG TPA: alkaline phosphatase family protein [Thermoanaerobaculia bacterium]|jgi:Flp pilus assembly protein TadD|nr:alkaline phosphatase family protein [Thermoanaerobaculia bacterium]